MDDNIPIIATSYEGFALGMQIPFSLLSALIALVLAFMRRARFVSVGFAICAILFTLAGVALELKNYGLHSFTRADGLGYVGMAFTPLVLAVGILLFGASRTGPPSK